MRNRPLVLTLLVVVAIIVIAGIYSYMQAYFQNAEEEPDIGMAAPVQAEVALA